MIKLSASTEDIKKAAAILKGGGLVAFPTETVYGLGADAFNANALARVFEAKGRPHFDPLIVHIADLDTLERVALLDHFNPPQLEQLRLLAHSFWPGPLTLVLPKQPDVPPLATAGLSTVAVRFPSDQTARQLIALSSGAVAAPSANRFGCLSPTRAEHVIETLGDSIDCIIDGGPCSVGVESTVLELIPLPRILRHGGICREDLEAVIGTIETNSEVTNSEKNMRLVHDRQFAVFSPGMLQNHYAPLIPLVLHSPKEMSALPYKAAEAYLFFSGRNCTDWLYRNNNEHLLLDNCNNKKIFSLSEQGSVIEAAANLFEYLHVLEKTGADCIHAETALDEGVGAAINDRLHRASLNKGL